MRILIDMGNTNTSIAVSEGADIVKRYFIHTRKNDVCPSALKRLLGKYLKKAEFIVVVSVVPEFMAILLENFSKLNRDIPVKVVGRDIKVPIKVNYTDPEEVGQDRLVAALSAMSLLRPPLLVVDFGTAVTFDLVGKGGAYEGGLIFPGVSVALNSLSCSAALLPVIEIKNPGPVVARDTESSMNTGIVMGYAAMCDGLIERFKEDYSNEISVVATGGDAALVAGHSKHIRNIAPDLIFRGLMDISNP